MQSVQHRRAGFGSSRLAVVVGLNDEPFGHALRVVSLGGGVQLGGFQRIGRRVLGVFHSVVHREEAKGGRSGKKKKVVSKTADSRAG